MMIYDKLWTCYVSMKKFSIICMTSYLSTLIYLQTLQLKPWSREENSSKYISNDFFFKHIFFLDSVIRNNGGEGNEKQNDFVSKILTISLSLNLLFTTKYIKIQSNVFLKIVPISNKEKTKKIYRSLFETEGLHLYNSTIRNFW